MSANQPTLHDHRPDPSYVPPGWMNEIRSSLAQLAVLTERNQQQDRRQVESEERIGQALARMEQQMARLHARLDDNPAETSLQIKVAIEPLVKGLEESRREVRAVRSDLDGWVNRGKGAWFVATIFAGVVQSVVVGSMVWLGSEVKALHDWRIHVEAQRPTQTNSAPK